MHTCSSPIRAEYAHDQDKKRLFEILSTPFASDPPQTTVSLTRIPHAMIDCGYYHNVLSGPHFSGCAASSFKAGFEPERAVAAEGRWSSDRETAGSWWRAELGHAHMITCLRITQPGGDGDIAGVCVCVRVCVCACVCVCVCV